MTADGIRPNETTVPLLHCTAADETLDFWRALGFAVTYEMRKPYLYLALRFSGFELHYGPTPSTVDAARETTGGCLVMVDAVAPYHAAFTASMRTAYGKVLATGRPRITRLRGLARVLDNARILRDFKNDDKAAYRALNSGLRRHGDTASTVERALALAGIVELLPAIGEPDRVEEFGARLRHLTLTPAERERVRAAVADPTVLDPWLPTGGG